MDDTPKGPLSHGYVSDRNGTGPDMAGLGASLFRRDSGSAASAPMSESPDPIRAELFSADRLEQHAESLGRQRILAGGETGRPLSPRGHAASSPTPSSPSSADPSARSR